MGLKILPIRNKSIGKSCNISKCKTKDKDTSVLIYPNEIILTPNPDKPPIQEKKKKTY